MTLHWWMHWFWVTALLLLHASSVKSFAQTGDLGDLQQITSPPERRARAMYYPKPLSPLNVTTPPTLQQLDNNTTTPNNTISTTQWTAVLPISTINTINNTDDDYLSQTVIDLNETGTSLETPTPDLNITVIPVIQVQNVTTNETKRNVTRKEFVKDESSVRDAPESKIVTEKPLSLETSYLQTRVPPKEVYRRTSTPAGAGSGLDVGAVCGLGLGAVALGALCASAALVVRRRRDLNPPHALHDKCSNPDSEGYLDDSTVRDNSEEMYSLDNDSFLNSLEAMTIQNYWTDTVKHTKL